MSLTCKHLFRELSAYPGEAWQCEHCDEIITNNFDLSNARPGFIYRDSVSMFLECDFAEGEAPLLIMDTDALADAAEKYIPSDEHPNDCECAGVYGSNLECPVHGFMRVGEEQ